MSEFHPEPLSLERARLLGSRGKQVFLAKATCVSSFGCHILKVLMARVAEARWGESPEI